MNSRILRAARCRILRRPAERKSARDVRVFDKGKQYNQIMQEKMQWTDSPFEYDFERGLYYHHILTDELLCGSQPTSAEDIRYLKEAENVNVIVSVRGVNCDWIAALAPEDAPAAEYERVYLSRHTDVLCHTAPQGSQEEIVCENHLSDMRPALQLQQEKDPLYWGVDTHAVHHAMHEHGITFKRTAVVDFDPESLRKTLPRAVHEIATAIDDGKKVYVHCTAGLGRAPACCIAYLFWFRDFSLDEAYEHLTKIRPCGPNRDAIRGATYDIVSGGDWHAFQALAPHMYTTLQQADKHMLQYHIFQNYKH